MLSSPFSQQLMQMPQGLAMFPVGMQVCQPVFRVVLRTAVFPFRYGKEVCDAIATKCLTGRPKTVEKAVNAFLLWVELEAVDGFLVSVIDF